MTERKRVTFSPNIQQQFSLADLDAVPESHSWGDNWYYELTDGRVLQVSQELSQKINMLELQLIYKVSDPAEPAGPLRDDLFRLLKHGGPNAV